MFRKARQVDGNLTMLDLNLRVGGSYIFSENEIIQATMRNESVLNSYISQLYYQKALLQK